MTNGTRVWPWVSAAGLAVSLTIVAGSAGALQGPPKSPKPDAAAAAKGKVIFQRYCGSCHGPSATGNGPLAKDLRVPPTDLTELAVNNDGVFPFDAVVSSIDGRTKTRGHGEPDMPVWGEVFHKTGGTEAPTTGTAVTRLVQYIWSIQKPASSPKPANKK